MASRPGLVGVRRAGRLRPKPERFVAGVRKGCSAREDPALNVRCEHALTLLSDLALPVGSRELTVVLLVCVLVVTGALKADSATPRQS